MEGRGQAGVLHWVSLFAIAVSGGSCGPPEPEDPEVSSGIESDRQMMHDDRTLQDHMEHMSAVPADSLPHVMPMHLQTVGAILGEMDPAYMGMQSDTVWRTTLDSVQNDLAQMRDMPAEQLSAFMPEHSRRVERLIFLHDSAMGSER
jgi:hypothetical protein